jgi:hypothetical protein
MKQSALVLLACLTLPIEAVQAEPINVNVATPPVVITRHAMTQRYSRLERFYQAGVIGLGRDADLKIHDATRLTLVQRQAAEKLIDAENQDRKSLVIAVAEAHEGKQGRQAEVRAAMYKDFLERFKPGWWIQDDQGNWTQKR